MTEHIEELSELYAIGAVDELERARVEQHVPDCEVCAERLRQAAETVAEIETAQPTYRPSPKVLSAIRASVGHRRTTRTGILRWTAGIAAAALLAVTIGSTWTAVDRTRRLAKFMQQDQQALARIASTPIVDRAVFSPLVGGRVQAEILYNPDAHWYYIVVREPHRGMQVGCVRNGRTVVLGTLAVHGASGSLYLPKEAKISEAVIIDDHVRVADAHLTI